VLRARLQLRAIWRLLKPDALNLATSLTFRMDNFFFLDICRPFLV
jgi:hypothetical protein